MAGRSTSLGEAQSLAYAHRTGTQVNGGRLPALCRWRQPMEEIPRLLRAYSDFRNVSTAGLPAIEFTVAVGIDLNRLHRPSLERSQPDHRWTATRSHDYLFVQSNRRARHPRRRPSGARQVAVPWSASSGSGEPLDRSWSARRGGSSLCPVDPSRGLLFLPVVSPLHDPDCAPLTRGADCGALRRHSCSFLLWSQPPVRRLRRTRPPAIRR